jgi:hypothetical protein
MREAHINARQTTHISYGGAGHGVGTGVSSGVGHGLM